MNILSIFLGLLLAIIFIIIGIYIITEYKIKYIQTDAIIEKAYCVLNNPNFNYLCDLHLSYIVNNYKYYARINKYINLVPYRKYDVITIFYNKNNPSEIEIKDNKYLYGIIPLFIGILILILTFLTIFSII
jgi:hypothetical protein